MLVDLRNRDLESTRGDGINSPAQSTLGGEVDPREEDAGTSSEKHCQEWQVPRMAGKKIGERWWGCCVAAGPEQWAGLSCSWRQALVKRAEVWHCS